ncbi:hypothetical protein CTI12_AA188150 [Artemisia annua]|uniref:Uncharacterized protein n=1 Tax=Artemisia annua TaxID=35608 RepID=A0A2U1P6Q3_ARTAN|nr:hypothetical protein CTI12_AA188150 [Artemisia annua]
MANARAKVAGAGAMLRPVSSSTQQMLQKPYNPISGDWLNTGTIHEQKRQQTDAAILDEEGTCRFMVNVIEPQYNLHSDDANGSRFLLAAVSGRVLARSFHAVLNVGIEMIKQALGSGDVTNCEFTWNRMQLSVMLEHVQAHVAPADVDPGAGLNWLPKIRRSSPKVKRTGALLERVFMPCDMFFRYTRHKGGTTDLKTIEIRNAVWSWLGELSKAFAPPKPSPSRHYAQRKLPEGTQMHDKNESLQDDASKSSSTGPGASSSIQKEASGSDPSLRSSSKAESQSFIFLDKHGFDDLTRRALTGRFLLAAVSGRVLARSFHAVLNVGIGMIKQALGSGDVTNSELTWNRMQLSVMLEYVQVLVAPTDVDPGAGLKCCSILCVPGQTFESACSQNITATMNWNWKPLHRASSWLNDLRDQVEQTSVLNVVFRSATALGSRLPSMANARAKVAGAGAMLRPISSSTQALNHKVTVLIYVITGNELCKAMLELICTGPVPNREIPKKKREKSDFPVPVKPLKELAFNSQNITATMNRNWNLRTEVLKLPDFSVLGLYLKECLDLCCVCEDLKDILPSFVCFSLVLLQLTRQGPHLLRKLDIDGYAKRPDQGKLRQTSREFAYDDFISTFGSKETKAKYDASFTENCPKSHSKRSEAQGHEEKLIN